MANRFNFNPSEFTPVSPQFNQRRTLNDEIPTFSPQRRPGISLNRRTNSYNTQNTAYNTDVDIAENIDDIVNSIDYSVKDNNILLANLMQKMESEKQNNINQMQLADESLARLNFNLDNTKSELVQAKNSTFQADTVIQELEQKIDNIKLEQEQVLRERKELEDHLQGLASKISQIHTTITDQSNTIKGLVGGSNKRRKELLAVAKLNKIKVSKKDTTKNIIKKLKSPK
jgi:chromosome segregation ATPase